MSISLVLITEFHLRVHSIFHHNTLVFTEPLTKAFIVELGELCKAIDNT